MAKKKEALQWDIQTEEEWNELLLKPGLWVVDVYKDWSGPCLCFQQVFKKIKNDVNDELLQFATVPCDKIEQLTPFRETCEPQWLFVAGGEFVGFMRGSNVVSMTKMIKDELEKEHAVLNGGESASRKVLKRIQSVIRPVKSLADFDRVKVLEENYEAKSIQVLREITKAKLTAKELIDRPFTIAVIKPDAIQHNKVPEILHQIKIHDIEILHQHQRILTEGEVNELYRQQKHYNYFNILLKLMVGGPSIVMVLAYVKGKSGDVIEDWKALLGPNHVSVARKNEPTSLRAKFGTDGYSNALHGSHDKVAAERELKYFFPAIAHELANPETLNKVGNQFLEYTLMIVRPHTLINFSKENIVRAIEKENLQILAEKTLTFDQGIVKDLYPYVATSRTAEILLSGPSCVMALCGNDLYDSGRLNVIFGPDSVHEAKKRAPKSLRAKFSKEERAPSGFHVSESVDTATREISLFFPKLAIELLQTRDLHEKKSKVDVFKSYSKLSRLQQVVVIVMPRTLKTYHSDVILQKIQDSRFTIYAQKVMTVTTEQAAQFFRKQEELFVFGKLMKAITSGPVMALCIVCEDAIKRVTAFLGPEEGIMARRDAPTSLRGTFFIRGDDVAPFYMTDTPETLSEDVELFFPDVTLQKSRLAVTSHPQHCVLIISPHILRIFSKDNIYEMCNDDELPICIEKMVLLTSAMVEQFFFNHRADIVFNRTMQILTNGESLVMAIYTNDAIRQVNDSLIHGRLSTLTMNDRDAIHVRASVDIYNAKNAMDYFFPKDTVLAIIKPDAFLEHKEKILQIIANVGLTIIGQCVDILTEDKISALYWKKMGEPYFPSLSKYMTSGKVLILALRGYSAAATWQRLVGPTDPDVAKETAPRSIRALFGKNILENAVHTSTNVKLFENQLNLPVVTQELLPEGSSAVLVKG